MHDSLVREMQAARRRRKHCCCECQVGGQGIYSRTMRRRLSAHADRHLRTSKTSKACDRPAANAAKAASIAISAQLIVELFEH
eukprot:1532701-Pleurochrysis_carterae.AAC.1